MDHCKESRNSSSQVSKILEATCCDDSQSEQNSVAISSNHNKTIVVENVEENTVIHEVGADSNSIMIKGSFFPTTIDEFADRHRQFIVNQLNQSSSQSLAHTRNYTELV